MDDLNKLGNVFCLWTILLVSSSRGQAVFNMLTVPADQWVVTNTIAVRSDWTTKCL